MTEDERARLAKVEAEIERLKIKDQEGYQVVPHRGDHTIARTREGYQPNTTI